MKVWELIEELQRLNPDGDMDVVAAIQPSWPLAVTVENAVKLEEEDTSEEDSSVIWIVTGSQRWNSPYAPRDVFEQI